MEMPAIQEQSKSKKWFCERWCRLTSSRCLGTFKVGKLVSESQPNATIEANKFIADLIIFRHTGCVIALKVNQKPRVSTTGFWVNPEFPFLGCSPDCLVGNDTVVEINALKIFKQYSVETGTCKNSPMLKNVLGRQCFKVEDGKCVLKHTHAYYYHIPLVTGRKYCDLFFMQQVGLIQ